MKNILCLFFSLFSLFSLLSLLFSPSAFSRPLSVRFGTVAPANTPWADVLERLKKSVAKKSGNSIKIKTYLGGQLGGELEILSGIRRGRIQGGGITSAALGTVIPEISVLELPFLFESYEEADYILDNLLYDPFKSLFEKKGLILVSWAENGWRNIGHKTKTIKVVADLKGIKIRSQENEAHMAFWKRFGVHPVPLAIPETLSALQTGLVEGFDNTALFTLAAEWHTGIKYFTITEHIYQPAAVVFSRKFWKTLTPQQKTIMMDRGNGIAPEARAGVRALGKELIDVLKSSGIEIYNMPRPERAKFKEASKSLHGQILKSLGKNSQRIYDLILKGKAEFSKRNNTSPAPASSSS